MAKNNRTRFFYVLYSDKTSVFDQLEGPIYITISNTKQHSGLFRHLLHYFMVKETHRRYNVHIHNANLRALL